MVDGEERFNYFYLYHQLSGTTKKKLMKTFFHHQNHHHHYHYHLVETNNDKQQKTVMLFVNECKTDFQMIHMCVFASVKCVC